MPSNYSLFPHSFVGATMFPPHFLGWGHARQQSSQPNLNMADILYVLTSIGFFALMIAFIWGCEKV